MTIKHLTLRLAGLSLSVALSGCFGVDLSFLAGPVSYNQGLALCQAETSLPEGDLKTQLVGTWQDWGGSYKIYSFDPHGKVSVAGYPTVTQTTAPTPGTPPEIEARGQYTVTGSSVSIAWDDGTTEVSQLELETEPGCVMLNVVPNGKAPTRLEGSQTGEMVTTLERVHCDLAPVEPAAAVHK